MNQYLVTTRHLFAEARTVLGENVELLHDVHSRLTPKQAVVLARALEPYRLFFLEDVVAPEHYDRLPWVTSESPLPIAVGEQLSSLTDAARLVQTGAVDLLRAHVSTVGGLSACRKLVALCEFNGVRTAWHGPGDVSPIGVAANIALDVTTSAFGIQEGHIYNETTHEVFPGTPTPVNGYLYPSDSPGWGVDLIESEATKYPPETHLHERWAAQVRRPDGGLEAP